MCVCGDTRREKNPISIQKCMVIQICMRKLVSCVQCINISILTAVMSCHKSARYEL